MTALDIFTSHAGSDLRVAVDANGEPWFVIADIARALDLSNPTVVAGSIETDDLSTTEVIDSMGRAQTARTTNEAGLYQLVFQSRKPEAKVFKRWVTHDVLPAIRKTGAYVAPTSEMDQIKALHAAVGTLLEHNEKITARAVQAVA